MSFYYKLSWDVSAATHPSAPPMSIVQFLSLLRCNLIGNSCLSNTSHSSNPLPQPFIHLPSAAHLPGNESTDYFHRFGSFSSAREPRFRDNRPSHHCRYSSSSTEFQRAQKANHQASAFDRSKKAFSQNGDSTNSYTLLMYETNNKDRKLSHSIPSRINQQRQDITLF